VVGKEKDSQNIGNLVVTNVPRCIGGNAKILGLKHLLFSDMTASGGAPDGERVVHHRTDLVLTQQKTIPDGETTFPV
jgi:hypothetical protein